MVINMVLVIASVVKIISYKATVILVVLVCLWKILTHRSYARICQYARSESI